MTDMNPTFILQDLSLDSMQTSHHHYNPFKTLQELDINVHHQEQPKIDLKQEDKLEDDKSGNNVNE